MEFSDLKGFLEVKREIDRNFAQKINALMVTFPGYSVSRYFKKIAETEVNNGLVYINSSDQGLGDYNLLDLDFFGNSRALDEVETYLRAAKLDQKFTVLINTPWILDKYDFESTYIGSHHYSIYKYKKPDIETVNRFAKTLGVELTGSELQKVYFLAGGVGRLGKFLLTHKDLVFKEAKELIKIEELERMLKVLTEAYGKASTELLVEYGVIENGSFSSSLVDEYVKLNPLPIYFDIKIDKQLDLYENGEKGASLGKFEARILVYLVDNRGVITKDKIAEIKWGDEDFAKFSDDAMKKTMLRLREKLQKHRLEAIHGYGYKLVLK